MTGQLENLEADQTGAKVTGIAWILSIAGLLPFAGLAIALSMINRESDLFLTFLEIFKTWSALVLAFLGGTRWGLVIARTPVSTTGLLLSVFPPATGWLAIFLLPDSYAVLVLLLAFCAHGAWDAFSVNAGSAPAWYGRIRMAMTFAVAMAHIAVFFALF